MSLSRCHRPSAAVVYSGTHAAVYGRLPRAWVPFLFTQWRKLCSALSVLWLPCLPIAFPFLGLPPQGAVSPALSQCFSQELPERSSIRGVGEFPFETPESLLGPSSDSSLALLFNPCIMLYFLHRTQVVWKYWFMWSVLEKSKRKLFPGLWRAWNYTWKHFIKASDFSSFWKFNPRSVLSWSHLFHRWFLIIFFWRIWAAALCCITLFCHFT